MTVQIVITAKLLFHQAWIPVLATWNIRSIKSTRDADSIALVEYISCGRLEAFFLYFMEEQHFDAFS